MQYNWRFPLIWGFTAIFILISFQNCAGGFSPDEMSVLSSSVDGPSIINSGALSAQVYDSTGTLQLSLNSLATGTAYILRASGAGILDAAVIWEMSDPNNSAACVLDGTGNQLIETITCANAGTGQVNITSYWSDGSVSTASITVTASGTANPGAGTVSSAKILGFNIPAGTGDNAWNSAASPLIGYVGQTLRITNKDNHAHQLRTSGAPCASQSSPSATNAYYDCVLAKAHNSGATAANNDLYDLSVGQNASFFLTVIDGPALYTSICSSCHGGLSASAKRGAAAATIRAAISTQPRMQNINITDDQLKAISFSLSQ